ncbi:MAG: hypothetical protein R2712_05945 [Vicinamibacterales bacterium]
MTGLVRAPWLVAAVCVGAAGVGCSDSQNPVTPTPGVAAWAPGPYVFSVTLGAACTGTVPAGTRIASLVTLSRDGSAWCCVPARRAMGTSRSGSSRA